MTELNIDNIKAQMRKGILEYCILSIISRQDAYASSIIAELKKAEMIVVEGTLYPEESGIAHVPLGGVATGSSAKILFDHPKGQGVSGTTRSGMERTRFADCGHP